jgi:hypothetical protein
MRRRGIKKKRMILLTQWATAPRNKKPPFSFLKSPLSEIQKPNKEEDKDMNVEKNTNTE